jgi:hypothetical protein
MNTLYIAGHIIGFFTPALGLSLIASTLAQFFWRHELSATPWLHLVLCSSSVCAATLLLGLILSGQDGTILTYGAMVLTCAASLCWALRGDASKRQQL